VDCNIRLMRKALSHTGYNIRYNKQRSSRATSVTKKRNKEINENESDTLLPPVSVSRIYTIRTYLDPPLSDILYETAVSMLKEFQGVTWWARSRDYIIALRVIRY
jgi:hypothetical protein